ncbi:MAG: TonB-dependent receptor [Gemmatimonadales bacterium]|nr:TonB-dependent receptor [Gemmatimonadales bacterium]
MPQLVRTAAVAAAVVALALVPPVRGAAQQVTRDTAQLAELTVTATRLPTRPGAVTVSQTVLRGDDLRARGIRFVLDALRDTPGAMLVQQGSFGGVTSLFLRGGNSNFTKVLIDGVPQNQPGGAFDFSNLTTDNVDRIEIVRGPASVLYGSDAVTGVIQVFTRQGHGRTRGEASAQGGSFGTALWNAGASGGDARLGWSGEVARTTTDGIFAFNNAYRNTVVSGVVRGRPDDRTDAQVAIRYGDSRAGFPTDFAGVPRDSNQFNFGEQLSVGLEAGRQVHERVEVRAQLGANLVDQGFQNDPDFRADTTRFGFRARNLAAVSRRSADLRANWRAATGVVVTAGAGAEFESIRSSNVTSSVSQQRVTQSAAVFDAARETYSGYVQAVADLASGLVLNAGARVDDNSAFGTFATFRGGVAYQVRGGPRLRGSAGRAFRAPTFPEQFATSAFEVGNPALSPERSTAWEVGAEHALLAGRVQLQATWFDQRFRDLIQYQFRPGQPSYYNIAAAAARGIETGLTVTPVDALTLQAQYTWLDTEVLDAGFQQGANATFVAGDRLLRRPTHQARVGARWRAFDRATLGGNLLVIGDRADIDFRPFPSVRGALPSYALVDLSADVDVTRAAPRQPALGVTLRLENALDARYETVYGFPGRGRALFAGGRVRF